jgi:hypothetical protein
MQGGGPAAAHAHRPFGRPPVVARPASVSPITRLSVAIVTVRTTASGPSRPPPDVKPLPVAGGFGGATGAPGVLVAPAGKRGVLDEVGVIDAVRVDDGEPAGAVVADGVVPGVPDAGVPDAGVPDAGVPDAGVPDAGAPVPGVATAVGVSVGEAAATVFVTVASHRTSAPPPFPEPLHWSM